MQRRLLVYGSMFIVTLLTQKLKQVNAEVINHDEDPPTKPSTSKIQTMNAKPKPTQQDLPSLGGMALGGMALASLGIASVYALSIYLQQKPVIVYIHGFRSSGKVDTEKRRKLFARETKVDVEVYEWGRKEQRSWNYWEAQKTAEKYVDSLCEYFKDLAEKLIEKGVKALYIMAHSMGNYLLSLSLRKMIDENLDLHFKKFEKVEIISVAADCGWKFVNDLVKDLMQNQDNPLYGITKWTHYYTAKDKVLLAPRGNPWSAAGRKALNNYQNVISIDCGNLVGYTDFGHSYIDCPKLFIRDVKQLMEGVDENERNTLETIDDSKKKFKIKN